MGGPWRERGYEAKRWHPPAARTQAKVDGPENEVRERGVVLAYVASVVLSIVLLFLLGRLGW